MFTCMNLCIIIIAYLFMKKNNFSPFCSKSVQLCIQIPSPPKWLTIMKVTKLQCLLRRHCAVCGAQTCPHFILPDNLTRKVLALSPFFRWGRLLTSPDSLNRWLPTSFCCVFAAYWESSMFTDASPHRRYTMCQKITGPDLN